VVLALVNELRKQGLEISDKYLKLGLLNVHQNTNFIGRWFEFSKEPLTICDTGHNQAGLEDVFNQLKGYSQQKHIILGFVNDKKIDDVIPVLPSEARFYFVKPSVSRGRHPEDYEYLLKTLI
jgi:dihydrofolate synthase/folylpolyglutamate synthase